MFCLLYLVQVVSRVIFRGHIEGQLKVHLSKFVELDVELPLAPHDQKDVRTFIYYEYRVTFLYPACEI